MDTQPHTLSIDALLADRGWLASLARSLVRDADAAADLAQDAWTTALERPPRTLRSPRGWLATVLRNRARDTHRRATRRSAREARVARPEALTATDELAERADTQRQVIEAVLALDQPYRSTVLWRYFDGHSTAEIAERTNVAVSTVRTRLARAHDQLRDRLRAAHGGDERAWRAALLPLVDGAGIGAPGGTAAAGALPAGGALFAIALLALLGVGVVLLALPSGDSPAPAGSSSPGGADAGPATASSRVPPAQPILRGSGERATAADPGAASDSGASSGAADPAGAPAAPADPAPPAVATTQLVVRVLDAARRPVEGADVILLDSSRAKYPGPRTLVQRAQSDARGEVRFEGLLPKGNLQVRAALHAMSAISRVYDGMTLPAEPVPLVLEPATTVAGRVVDAEGRAVADAVVALYVELPGSMEVVAARRTDTSGGFRIDGVPRTLLGGTTGSTAAIEVMAQGFGESWTPIPAEASDLGALEIPIARARVIRGRVVDADGAPIPGVSLEFPDANGGTETDAEGRFEAGRLPQKPIHVLFQSSAHAPRRLRIPFDGALEQTLDDVVLRPGRPIAGQVVDARGEPVPEVFVAIASDAAQQIVRQGGVDDAGRFRFEHLGEGPHEIHVFTSAGGETTLAGVEAGTLDVRVVLRKGPHLLLRFRDATGAHALPIDAVSFHAHLGDDPDVSVGASHGGEGMESLRLELPRSGRWDLTVRVAGYQPFEKPGIDVSHDRGTHVDVRLVPLGR